ncbi:phage holin family protein [Olleya sp. HaHaR_3_96]|uniref:phage holin family protein n=1 Tax=Olleya sp. HaHaR_3_96 TaxID=2745560 RepID=UPI001C4EAA5A|nr:phage holin family protein [Olleya sp. HaHaR_3_96]QXP60168.1 phage holin family protein [Olleya sp. HaHaR_3_96]
MNLIIRLLLNAVAVFFLANILGGVAVENYTTAIIVAAVISILNLLVKPILVILTFPITIITLGLFLFVVNGLIILLADNFISGFSVSSIWTAILFSILLSILQSVFQSFLKTDSKSN